MMFGQVVVGPPGSGKSIYCAAMKDLMEQLGRKVTCLNLDPANDLLPYSCSIDISSLIRLYDVMTRLNLGPNGGLIYCMEYLESNLEWLDEQLRALDADSYLLFDLPGQVELFTHHQSFKRILNHLSKLGHRIVTVHLTDSNYCSEPSKFISVLMTSLATMVQLETPHLNLLSKADLFPKFAPLPFPIDYFTEVLDLSHLLLLLNDEPFFVKYKQLNRALCDVVEDFNLVNFLVCSVNQKDSMLTILKAADQANGYCFFEKETPELGKSASSSGDRVTEFMQKVDDLYNS